MLNPNLTMKTNTSKSLSAWRCSALCGLIAVAASSSLAQNTNPTNTFDNAASTTSFVQWWGGGGAGATMTWDATLDAANDAASGSVRYDVNFVGNAGEQFMTFFTIANRWGWDFGYILDATTYTNLSFDIKVDPASGQRVNNNDFGWLEIGLCTGTGPATTALPGRAIPLSATNWTHFDYPLQPTLANIDQVSGFFIKMWSNGDHTNTLSFNIDNFMITKPTAPVVIPPPTVSLKQNTSGLNLLASGPGQYDRQQIRTVDSNLGWVGSAEPITYELTIKEAPAPANSGYQAHIFLVPNSTDTASSIDWNAPELYWMHIENLANGGGQVTFRYKTNCPQQNNMLFNTDPAQTNSNGSFIGVGNLGTITSTNILGTWKMTLSQDTNITLVASDGTTTNFSITADAAALFAGTVQAFFGAQPNNLAYGGLGYVFSHVKISTPSTTLIEDDFTGDTLDTVKWVKQASDAPGVFVVPPSSPLSLVWTLPAAGFAPELTTNLAAGSTWVALSSSAPFKIQTTMRQLLSTDELNSNQNYFRLLKRTFTQLQILLPGESPAPNTPTGKTGTPTTVNLGAGGTIDVTVRAVDSTWNLVTSASDMIHLTTTDATAFVPPDQALSSGVTTFTATSALTFGQTGTFTISATNLSRVMPEATSSPVTVDP